MIKKGVVFVLFLLMINVLFGMSGVVGAEEDEKQTAENILSEWESFKAFLEDETQDSGTKATLTRQSVEAGTITKADVELAREKGIIDEATETKYLKQLDDSRNVLQRGVDNVLDLGSSVKDTVGGWLGFGENKWISGDYELGTKFWGGLIVFGVIIVVFYFGLRASMGKMNKETYRIFLTGLSFLFILFIGYFFAGNIWKFIQSTNEGDIWYNYFVALLAGVMIYGYRILLAVLGGDLMKSGKLNKDFVGRMIVLYLILFPILYAGVLTLPILNQFIKTITLYFISNFIFKALILAVIVGVIPDAITIYREGKEKKKDVEEMKEEVKALATLRALGRVGK